MPSKASFLHSLGMQQLDGRSAYEPMHTSQAHPLVIQTCMIDQLLMSVKCMNASGNVYDVLLLDVSTSICKLTQGVLLGVGGIQDGTRSLRHNPFCLKVRRHSWGGGR